MPKLVIGLVIILSLIGVGYYWQTKHKTQVTVPSSAPMASVNDLPQPTTFTDSSLGYSFTYPSTVQVQSYPDIPGGQIENYSMRIEGLSASQFNPKNPQGLLSQDLYCSASGPGVNISCKNTKVTSSTNPQGVTIYRVDRTKTTEGGANAGSVPDEAYVFAVTKNPQYTGVLMSVDQVDPSNIQHMLDILQTVTITP